MVAAITRRPAGEVREEGTRRLWKGRGGFWDSRTLDRSPDRGGGDQGKCENVPLATVQQEIKSAWGSGAEFPEQDSRVSL